MPMESYADVDVVICNIDPEKEDKPLKNIIKGEPCMGVKGRVQCVLCDSYNPKYKQKTVYTGVFEHHNSTNRQ